MARRYRHAGLRFMTAMVAHAKGWNLHPIRDHTALSVLFTDGRPDVRNPPSLWIDT